MDESGESQLDSDDEMDESGEFEESGEIEIISVDLDS